MGGGQVLVLCLMGGLLYLTGEEEGRVSAKGCFAASYASECIKNVATTGTGELQENLLGFLWGSLFPPLS